MTRPSLIWVLLDDRPGTANQALGVAESLGKPFIAIPVLPSLWAHLPNGLLWFLNSFMRRCLPVSGELMIDDVCPDLVIAAGRRSAFVALWIKRKFANRPHVVQIMDPKWRRDEFDILAIPEHDDLRYSGKNILRIKGNPHRLTKARLDAAKTLWQPAFADLPDKKIALLLGGTTKGRGLDVAAAKNLIDRANALAKANQAGLLISTSRRTPVEAIEYLSKAITAPHFIYDWRSEAANPYAGILASADAILVSGDSTSMLAESCATAKPVYIFTQPGMVSAKHARFHQQLIDGGFARLLSDRIDFTATTPSFRCAETIVDIINKTLP